MKKKERDKYESYGLYWDYESNSLIDTIGKSTGKLCLDISDIEWIRRNIKNDGEFYTTFSFHPSTKYKLCEREYKVNSSEGYHDAICEIGNLKNKPSFFENIFSTLLIDIRYNPPLQLLRKKKLERII